MYYGSSVLYLCRTNTVPNDLNDSEIFGVSEEKEAHRCYRQDIGDSLVGL